MVFEVARSNCYVNPINIRHSTENIKILNT